MLVSKLALDPSLKQRRLRSSILLIIFTILFFIVAYLFHVSLFVSVSVSRYRISNNPNDIYVSRAASQLPLNTSMFLFVMTAPLYHKTRVPALNATWLHRFPHAEIFTSEALKDENIPYRTVFNGFDDSYDSLFYKSKFGFYYAYKSISDKFDWYLKVDDDSYLVYENMVKFLKTLDPNKPIYAGFRLKPFLDNGYNSGSVYVLSRAAVQIFVEALYNDAQKCPFDQYEDLGIGRCLANADVYPMPTRDTEDKGRFHLFNAFETYNADIKAPSVDFYYKDGPKTGFDEFSSDLISLHHVSPGEMFTADLFLYRVKTN